MLNADCDVDGDANAARRVVRLDGGVNFRDLGGYQTADGRRLRWGRLYRSGSMGQLTEHDYAVLAGLNIAHVHDLRSRSEREKEPNRWADAPGIAYWSRDYDSASGVLAKMLASLPDRQAAEDALHQSYRDFPFEHAPSYRALAQRIRDGQLPLVFNCSAGKDRAGTAAALILRLLGVPQETVVRDYLLTDKLLHHRHEAMARVAASIGTFPPEVWDVLMRTNAQYLQSAFDAIDERHGSLAGYFHEVLQIDPAGIDLIKGRLLEPPASPAAP